MRIALALVVRLAGSLHAQDAESFDKAVKKASARIARYSQDAKDYVFYKTNGTAGVLDAARARNPSIDSRFQINNSTLALERV